MSDVQYDVIIIGSGGAGLTTAVVCAHAGLRTLVVEKASLVGGSTAYSSGVLWIPGNHFMATFGQIDSLAFAKDYLRSTLGDYYQESRVDGYLRAAPEMIDYLERNSRVRFAGVPVPDYFPDHPGAMAGRSILTQPYDGGALGPWIKKIRNPLSVFAVLNTMQVDILEAPRLMGVFRNADSTVLAARRFAGFLRDWLRYGKGAYLANGNALVGRLLHSALEAGVEVWVDAPAVRLLSLSDGVSGVLVKRPGREVTLKARGGVVLASGGYGANEKMLSEHLPLDQHLFVQPEGNVGDGLRLGQSVGGAVTASNSDVASFAPVSALRDRHGAAIKRFPHFGDDRSNPGSIIVAQNGRRFVNEAAHYQHIVRQMHRFKTGPVYMIADQPYLTRYGMGIARAGPFPVRPLVRAGYLQKAQTVAELAGRIAVDSGVLVETINHFNAMARTGIDTDFNRGGDAYNRFFGDPNHRPNPCLGPIETAPFYAIKLHPGSIGTVRGLETSADAQVLRADGSPIRGLYAVGLDQNSVFRGVYVGAGAAVGPGMVFGYRAARQIIRGANADMHAA